MAIHELDELTARRVGKLEAKHGRIGVTANGGIAAFPLAGDAEQTAVRFDIPTQRGGIVLGSATVVHDGETVKHVVLPPHFRDWAAAAGLDRLDETFEHYLWAVAKMAFARQARHLVCAKCDRSRDAVLVHVDCDDGHQHDWMVAR